MSDIQIKTRSAMAVVNNAELLDLYRSSAKMGAENLGSSIPEIRIQATGKSLKNILLNGEEASDGFFYYKPTRSQTKTLTCHILTISKGFRADGYNDKKNVFNQILAGLFIVEDKKMPFIMYFNGTKLQNLWAFADEASLYTKKATLPIPMFALTVELTTRKAVNPKGSSWVVDFKIQKDEEGQPVLITDPKEFVSIKNQVESIQQGINDLVEKKSTGEVVPSEEIPTADNF